MVKVTMTPYIRILKIPYKWVLLTPKQVKHSPIKFLHQLPPTHQMQTDGHEFTGPFHTKCGGAMIKNWGTWGSGS